MGIRDGTGIRTMPCGTTIIGAITTTAITGGTATERAITRALNLFIGF